MLAGPMARAGTGKDYFVNEVALVKIGAPESAVPVMIARWYMREDVLVAKVHPLRLSLDKRQFVVDARDHQAVEVPLTSFLLNVEDLHEPHTQAEWHLPAPDKIYGEFIVSGQRISCDDGILTHNILAGIIRTDDPRTPIDVWYHPSRSPWRIRAAGRRVHGLPIWLYCDDTSGNVSKKWNKHNSILFVLAGLPHHCTTQLHNVHFLSTSNIAPPLEMMEQVSEVLRSVSCGYRATESARLTVLYREARDEGIEVWDCLNGEEALVIPWVLAFQGDNPMASEFASHIGMSGRCICRVCEVYAGRTSQGAHATATVDDTDTESDTLRSEKKRLTDFITVGLTRLA